MGPVGQLLHSPDVWVRAGTATNQAGHYITHDHPKACKWSIRGAFMKCYPHDHPQKLEEFMEATRKYYPIRDYEQLTTVMTFEVLHMLLKETNL